MWNGVQFFRGALCAPAAGAESKCSARRYRVVNERVFVLGTETGTTTTAARLRGRERVARTIFASNRDNTRSTSEIDRWTRRSYFFLHFSAFFFGSIDA